MLLLFFFVAVDKPETLILHFSFPTNPYLQDPRPRKPGLFSEPLNPRSRELPLVLVKVVDYFDHHPHGVNTEGLFRLSGNQTEIQQVGEWGGGWGGGWGELGGGGGGGDVFVNVGAARHGT